jgi:hypothetical protein
MVGTLDEALAATKQRQQEPLSQLDRDIIGGPIRLPIRFRPGPENLRRTAKQLRGYADAMTEILEREGMSDRSKLLEIRFALLGLRSKYEERSPDRRVTPKAATGGKAPHARSPTPKHRRVVGRPLFHSTAPRRLTSATLSSAGKSGLRASDSARPIPSPPTGATWPPSSISSPSVSARRRAWRPSRRSRPQTSGPISFAPATGS